MTLKARIIRAFTFCTFIPAIMLVGCGLQGTKPKSDQASQSLSISYEKYTLDNGLTVILHEDHSDPVAHVDVTYHVGSAREELGKSGYAHLFEHMMFQGSENVADEEHIKLVTEAGGRMNGTTNRDRTNYFETVPANHLETMLWLEADRMGFFLEGITQEKFEIQRATVINEKQQNYDNRAYGRYFELSAKTLYPFGHPYSWLTIGDLEDLDKASADDLKNFFLRWYGPNNATLTIGGDINPKEVKAWVNKYFGGIAKGPKVEPLKIPGFELEQDRYVSYYDDKVQFPAVAITFPSVPMFHPDAPALRCLADILGSGKGSYLYQNFVAKRLAIDASASFQASELSGEFFMFVLPFPGKSLSDFEKELRASLDQFELNGVSDTDLQKFKADYETGFIYGLETVSGKVSKLAYYNTFANNPGYFSTELERHLAVNKEDVMRVFKRYIKDRPSVVVSVLAQEGGTPARPDNYQTVKNGNNPYPKTHYAGLTYNKVKDSFDRTIKPNAQQAKLASPPKYWTEKTDNNIHIIGTEMTELPTISLRLSLPGGYDLDRLNLEKRGLVQLTSGMLNTSTQNYTERAIAEELEKLGSAISFGTSSEHFNITVRSLTKNLDKTLELLEEKLFRPAFLEADFKRIQQQQLEGAKSSIKQASSISPMVYSRLIYGAEHSSGIPTIYAVNTLPNVTIEDVREFHQKYYSPSNAELVVVGDISKAQILEKLKFLFSWKKDGIEAIQQPATPIYKATTLYFVNKENAAQSEIRIGYLGDIPLDATGEHFRRGLMNFTLGGTFNSRINLNLREDKGVTYGARTRFEAGTRPGPFTASTSVKSNSTALAVREILKEINTMRTQPISQEELRFLKQAIGQSDALDYEANYQKAGFLSKILRYKFKEGFVEEQKRIVEKLTQEDVLTLAKKHLPIDKMIIVVVGDKKTIFNDLDALGYPIIEVDEAGDEIK